MGTVTFLVTLLLPSVKKKALGGFVKSFILASVLFSSTSLWASIPVRFSVLPAKCTASVQKDGTTKYSGACPKKDLKITGTVDTPDKATAISERAKADVSENVDKKTK